MPPKGVRQKPAADTSVARTTRKRQKKAKAIDIPLDDSEQVDAAHSVAADGAIASVALEESVGEDDDAATEEPKLSVDLMTAFLGPLAGEAEKLAETNAAIMDAMTAFDGTAEGLQTFGERVIVAMAESRAMQTPSEVRCQHIAIYESLGYDNDTVVSVAQGRAAQDIYVCDLQLLEHRKHLISLKKQFERHAADPSKFKMHVAAHNRKNAAELRKKEEQEARKASADAEKESKAAVKEVKRQRESRVRAAGMLHTKLSGEHSRISAMIRDREGSTENLVGSKEARDQAESVLAEVNSYIENPSVEMPGEWIATLEYVRFRIKTLTAKRPNAK